MNKSQKNNSNDNVPVANITSVLDHSKHLLNIAQKKVSSSNDKFSKTNVHKNSFVNYDKSPAIIVAERPEASQETKN